MAELRDTQPDTNKRPGLLLPGRNCWRIERAHRLSFLIDGAAYFRAVREAIVQARRSIYILGWDIDSRTRLVPEGADDGFPQPLGEFLHEVVARRRGLRAYVLSWDFAMLYVLDREWLPVYKLGWRTHRRLTFRLDGRHPVGACHHQKVVVIDDELAFVGGMDLTHQRWDTPAHACDDPLRCDPDGSPYRPFHDIQAMVDGAAARALGELARERWRRATGRRLAPRRLGRNARHDPWPAHCRPDITDVDVAISRTEPPYDGHPGVQEIRRLYEDGIAAARRCIYLENQYFTAVNVGDALAARLREPDGPEIVLVSRRLESGWLEARTMGVLRAGLHRQLKDADQGKRYHAYYPDIPGLTSDSLDVHSKLMIVDDELLTVGSANLANRSMVLDTECNIAIEARGDERIRRAIARLRSRLLAEHLDVDQAVVEAEIARAGTVNGAIAALMHPGRSLVPLEPVAVTRDEELILDRDIVDPEQPIDPEQLIAEFVPREASGPVSGRAVRLGALVMVSALLAAAWRWTPLGQWLDLESLGAVARTLNDMPFSYAAMVGGYVLAGLLVLPVTALNSVTALVFDPVTAWLYAVSGSLASASVTYSLGRWLGRDTVRRLAGTRINRLSQRIARRGILAVLIVRLLPIAPFTLVNVVAGASHIRLRDYLIGTFLGMAPGITATVLFVRQVLVTIREPSLTAFAALALLAGVLAGLALALRRYLMSKEEGFSRA